MSIYGRLFAAGYDRLTAPMEQAGLTARRSQLLTKATGRVLELGAGTGVNLPLYPESVTELVLTEPEEPMAVRLDRRCAQLGLPAEVIRAAAESLPFEDDRFDTVVVTLVLCTVADLPRSVAEIERVLRPGGKLLFIEHVRSSSPGLARWQDRLNPIQKRIARGCNCNRDTAASLSAAGLRIEQIEHRELEKAPPYIRPSIDGVAVAAR